MSAADGPVDFELLARATLPPHVSAYYAAFADAGPCHAEGQDDWAAFRFRPRVLTDVSKIDIATTVLGTPVRTPVLVAPMAQLSAAHPDGEAAVGRAVADAGSLLGVSTQTAIPFAEIAAAGAPWWFQVYVMRDRGLTEHLVRRASEHGARALILTADMIALLRGAVNPRNWPEGPAKRRLGNLTESERSAAGTRGLEMDPSIDLGTIAWLRQISGLPVLVKGVLRGDDARRCVDAGAAGLVVSTHGGRRMGTSTSSARSLPEVVSATGDRAEVYVDSGLRTADHVAAALALGARAVFVGRPFAWALAASGTTGVAQVLGDFDTDLHRTLTQLGVSSLGALSPDILLAGPTASGPA